MYVLMLVLCLFFQAPSPSAKPENPVVKNSKASTKAEQSPKGSPSVTPPVAESTPMGKKPSEGKKDEHHEEPDKSIYRVDVIPHTFDWRDGLYVLYILVTGIAALVAWRALLAIKTQAGFMNEQLVEMREARKQTDDLIKLNERMVTLEHRAWIKFDEVTFSIAPLEPINVTLSVKNIGRTPAVCLRSWIVLEHVPQESEPNYSYDDVGAIPASPVMPPNSPLALPVGRGVLSQSTFNTIQRGERRMFVHAKVEYADIFQPRPRTADHWITICLRYEPSIEKFVVHDEYNETGD